MKALITGASGFIGSHLARALAKSGVIVELLVRKDSKLAGELSRFQTHVYDGSTQNLVASMKQSKPDVVFHLASLFLAAHTPNDVERLIESNVLFSTQLLEAMSEAGVTKFVNTGTSWQNFLSDDEVTHPVNLYAATKTAFEAILQYYVEAKGFSAVGLKIFDTYGENDPRSKLIQLLIKTLRTNTPLSMSPGEQKIDLVYIDDVVSAFLIAGERVLQASPSTNESFTIETGHPVSIQELVQILNRVSGQKAPVTFGGRPYREREVMKPWSKGQRIPGWAPRVSLDEGLRRLLDSKAE